MQGANLLVAVAAARLGRTALAAHYVASQLFVLPSHAIGGLQVPALVLGGLQVTALVLGGRLAAGRGEEGRR